MSVEQRKAALTCSAKARARAEALELRLAGRLRRHRRRHRRQVHRPLARPPRPATTTAPSAAAHRLAQVSRRSGGRRWPMRSPSGRLNLAQPRVIADALAALPQRPRRAPCWPRLRATWSSRRPHSGRGSLARLGPAGAGAWSLPRSPTRPSTSELLADERRSQRRHQAASCGRRGRRCRPTSHARDARTSTPDCCRPSATRSPRPAAVTSTRPSVPPSRPSPTSDYDLPLPTAAAVSAFVRAPRSDVLGQPAAPPRAGPRHHRRRSRVAWATRCVEQVGARQASPSPRPGTRSPSARPAGWPARRASSRS